MTSLFFELVYNNSLLIKPSKRDSNIFDFAFQKTKSKTILPYSLKNASI